MAELGSAWGFNMCDVFAAWVGQCQNMFTVAFKGAALRNIANLGTAFNDPILGQDRQIAHFSQYDDCLGV
ncbi:uncharacterized protein FTOL_11895 [Fusarium torulosum]|uniref:Uncharacterized protein n=1 Tax=Fusarium torulosum TaxID=33205 RepID=A0AAE8SNA8_9HYPO|nr:uncharacterized protein FTOL_11895 [Fusarium torulosum]